MIPTDLSPVANHLWQSTVFAAAAWLLTLALRKNRAAVRYWIWLAASVKFLIPFAVLIHAGSQLPWRPAPAMARAQFSGVVNEVSQPFAEGVAVPLFTPTPVPRTSRLPAIVLGVWVCGSLLGLIFWLRLLRQIRTIQRTATPLDLRMAIPVLSSPARLEPGVFGVRKPVLILPAGITERLTPEQLAAVLAHELCHVWRRDNLTAAIHMVVETIFWFHPLVWWMRTQLVAERERACDEEVVRLATDPLVYAEGILNVCKFYLEAPVPCVSGVTGANLKKRIEEIMSNRIVLGLSSAKRLALATAAAAALAAPVVVGIVNAPASRAQSAQPAAPAVEAAAVREPASQTQPTQTAAPQAEAPAAKPPAQQPQAQPAAGPQFEVASVKVAAPSTRRVYILRGGPGSRDPGQLTGISVPLQALVLRAYDIRMYQLVSTRSLEGDKYDIEAKIPDGTTEPQLQLMLRDLLEERIGLVLHHETRDIPAFEMVVAKGGLKLKPAEPAPANTPQAPAEPGARPTFLFGTSKDGLITLAPGQHTRAPSFVNGHDHISARGQTAADLRGMMEIRTGHPVVDKTGLTGVYDFELDFTADASPVAAPPAAEPAAASEPFPTFVEAIQQQLGLKLEATKSPMDVIVVERWNKMPTGN